MSTVTIYTSPDCTACYAAKLRMRAAGVEFEEVDLASNPGALAYVRDELGHRQAPVTVRTGPSGQVDHWSGFRLEKIRQLETECVGSRPRWPLLALLSGACQISRASVRRADGHVGGRDVILRCCNFAGDVVTTTRADAC
ncbi:glutaredoxin domain-containing protein [Occultella aeris]|uniref:Glutaredoxin-like protein NrdH n=1 Tax=Occultella aeris TaxID=2761496 RepID=A0A7M4DJH2_9MICO|nr:glutaredoxin domain-containing protein [Occultella aeris]VZO37186.1 Glutaredoxin-like protein NrdH [Occultella aeris]